MLKYTIIFSLIFNFYSTAQRNFIIAGQHDANDYYYKFIPNTIVIRIPSQTLGYYSVDINNDGIMDFKFSLLSPYYLASGNDYFCAISSLNNDNSIAVEYYDSCGYDIYANAYNFYYNDTIGANAIWNSDVYLDYYHYHAFGGGVGCLSFDSGDTGYIGVRIKVDTAYQYGWIEIAGEYYNAFSTTTLSMGTFACQNKITGVKEFANAENIKIFPNPASDRLMVECVNSQLEEIRMYDKLAKKIISTNKKDIDVSNLENGIYFIEVILSNGAFNRKIIIQR